MQTILFLCALTIIVLLAMQYVWIKDYYKSVQLTFEKDINLAFEDAIKKEFSLRSDTVQMLIEQELFDSSKYEIRSKYHGKDKEYVYTIHDKPIKKDIASFSTSKISGPFRSWDTTMRRKIAVLYASSIRNEDLNNHIVFYRTQQLGRFVNASILKYNFDTARLRPVLQYYLSMKGIHEPFIFYMAGLDSLSSIPPVNLPNRKRFPIATQSVPTYKWEVPQEQYVRAQFASPVRYILSRTKWILVMALCLIISIALVLFLLFRALQKEKHLAQIKDDFIQNMTHELKTPIATVSASIEAMFDFNVLDDKQKTLRYLGYAKDGVSQLGRLTKKVLDTAWFEKNGTITNKELFYLLPVLNELESNFSIHSEKYIHIEIQCVPDLQLYADLDLFREVLNNVLENAIKYSNEIVDIHVVCKKDENNITIAVKDNGWGISKEDLPVIFDKFFRAHTQYHSVKGHGLGLNIVRNIMHAHAGEVNIDSVKNIGTKVKLSWPI